MLGLDDGTICGESSRPRDWRVRVLAPPAWAIVAALALFAVDQFIYQRVGSATLPQALLDWIDHLLTTLFLLWVLRGVIHRSQLVPALIASLVIDADHIPGYFGSHVLTAGTHRPYTHSLVTVLVLAALARGCGRWRTWFSGAAIGLASHLWRDLAEPRGAGVALLWPASDRTITTPAVVYLASIAVLGAISVVRAVRAA